MLSPKIQYLVAVDGRLKLKSVLGVDERIELSGTVVVTDDGWGIAEEICLKLEGQD